MIGGRRERERRKESAVGLNPSTGFALHGMQAAAAPDLKGLLKDLRGEGEKELLKRQMGVSRKVLARL